MGKFDDILAKLVPDENHRKTVTQLAEQYPELGNGWLRGDEFSRKMDEVSGIKKDAEWAAKAKPHVAKWEQWRTEHWDDSAEMTKEEKAARDKVAELEVLVAAKTGDDMDFKQISDLLDTQMAAKNIAYKSDIESIKTDVSNRVNEFDKTFQGATYISAKIPTLVMKAYKEFGEVLDGAELLRKSEEMKDYNLDNVYNTIFKDKSTARQDEDRKKLEAEAEKRGYEAALKELKEKTTGSKDGQGQIPTDQGSGLSGFLQKAVSGEETGAGYEALTLGRGAIAHKYAEEFRQKQG